jgi:hypothetical protein
MLALACVVVTVAGTSVPALATTSPTASVTPATGVADGQTVTVSASGLPPNHAIQVEECAGTVDNPPTDNTSCDGVTLDSSTDTDAGGAYTNTGYTVYTRPSSLLPSPATITCDAGHPCVLYVGVDQNNFSSAHAFAALTFSDSVTTTTTAPATTTTTGATTSTTGTGASTTTTAPDTGTTDDTTDDTLYDDKPPRSTTTTQKHRTTSTTGSALGGATTTTANGTGSGSTATTVAGAGSTATTAAGAGPAPTVTTSPASLHDSGGANAVLGDSPAGGPSSVPTLPLTGGPHGAALLALGGVAVALGGSEVRRRALRPREDGRR